MSGDRTVTGKHNVGAAERSPELAATAPVAAAMAEPAGRIGRYEIVRRLGEGGMGVVFVARDGELGRDVALKLMRGDRREDTERLRREARSLAKLRHPNVVTIYEVGEHDDGVYLAMEYVEGATLREWMAGDHDWRERIDPLIQAANGLTAAHDAGLVHRDVKPDNVIVGRDGRVQVVDFGLARSPHERVESPETDEPEAGPASLTRTGVIVGTPAYMAPEQFLGDAVSARTDQFAFCVTAFEVLYGVKPFGGDTVEEVKRRVLAGTVCEVPADSDIPHGVLAALRTGMAVDAADRHDSMAPILEALEAMRSGPAIRSSRLPRIAAAVAVIALLGAGGLWLAFGRDDAAQPATAGSDAGTTPGEPKERARALFEQGLEHYRAGDYARAIEVFNEGYLAWPDPVYLFNIAQSYRRLDDCGSALIYYERYRDANRREWMPTIDETIRELRAHCPGLDPARLADDGDAGPPPDDDEAAALLRRAGSHMARLEWAEARDAYLQAIRAESTRAAAQVGLARVAFETRDYEAATRFAAVALESGASREALLLLGHVSFKRGDYAAAIERYEAVLADHPNDNEASTAAAAARSRLADSGD